MNRSPSPHAIQSMLRVNHAGEYGAKRIYAGQLAIMGDRDPAARKIAHMAEQEQKHLDTFDTMLIERGIRPSAMQPFWHVAGFALGAITAVIGPKAAMACTAAVETEIDEHYRQQLAELGDTEPELAAKIEEFRLEELEHKDIALAEGAEKTLAYPLMSAAIRLGCRAAIAIAKRV
jgi:3-demethoxyubiquinol 3-hydroxylase